MAQSQEEKNKRVRELLKRIEPPKDLRAKSEGEEQMPEPLEPEPGSEEPEQAIQTASGSDQENTPGGPYTPPTTMAPPPPIGTGELPSGPKQKPAIKRSFQKKKKLEDDIAYPPVPIIGSN